MPKPPKDAPERKQLNVPAEDMDLWDDLRAILAESGIIVSNNSQACSVYTHALHGKLVEGSPYASLASLIFGADD